MALEKKIVRNVAYTNNETGDVIFHENTYNKAYIVVSDYNGVKNNTHFTATIYEDSTKSLMLYREIYEFTHNPAPDAKNIIEQAYIYLKSLPAYSDAKDV